MTKQQLKELIRELLGEVSRDTLQSYLGKVRGKDGEIQKLQAKAGERHLARDLPGAQATQQKIDKRSKGRDSAERAVWAKDDAQIQGARDQMDAALGKQSPVPPQVQQAVQSGGKVVFGKYFDTTGKYLGKTVDGKWVDASQVTESSTLLKDLLQDNI